MKPFWTPVWFVLSALILWYGYIWVKHPAGTVLPPPELVVGVLVKEWPTFALNTWVTLATALVGYFFANVVAIGLAVSFLYVPSLQSLSTPWVLFLKNLPIISIASMLMASFGDAPTPRIIVVILVCFHMLLANLTKGFAEVDPNLLARFKTLRATRWQMFRYVLWPNALPYYLAAHEVAFTSSIIAAVVAEFFFSRQGLGALLTQSINDSRGERTWAVNVIIAGLSAGSFALSKVAERRLIPWRN